MHNIPLVEKNMFNTLVFSKKMQNVGMTQEVSEELASTLLNLHVNQFENLLTKNDFSKFETEIKKEIDDVKNEIDDLKNEIDDVKNEMKNFVTKNDFSKFEIEIKKEIENFVTKKEFYAEIKNLSLNLTIKIGVIMLSGIGALALIIKL
jgi:hypothetical protein